LGASSIPLSPLASAAPATHIHYTGSRYAPKYTRGEVGASNLNAPVREWKIHRTCVWSFVCSALHCAAAAVGSRGAAAPTLAIETCAAGSALQQGGPEATLGIGERVVVSGGSHLPSQRWQTREFGDVMRPFEKFVRRQEARGAEIRR